MTRTSKEHPAPVPGEPESPGGRAAERLNEFTQARGLGDEEAAAQAAHPREAEGRDVSTSDQRDPETVTSADADADADAADDPPPAVDDMPPTDQHPDAMPPRGVAPSERSSD
jgi:hypothetical protein